MSDEARKHGLPENLSAEEVAQALEDAASEIRRGDSHEGWLLDAISSHADKKREDTRRLLGGQDQ
jgi:hypothetical protein